jgi:hypothetical protein
MNELARYPSSDGTPHRQAKAYTVGMANHDRLLRTTDPAPELPAYADFGLAAHLAKEGVSVYTTDHMRFLK